MKTGEVDAFMPNTDPWVHGRKAVTIHMPQQARPVVWADQELDQERIAEAPWPGIHVDLVGQIFDDTVVPDFLERALERLEIARLSDAEAFITGRRPVQLYDFTHRD